MAYALVGSLGPVVQTAAGSAVSGLAWGQTPTAGNLLVIMWSGQGSVTVATSPSGFNGGQQKSSTTQISQTWYKQAAGGDAVPTFAGITSSVQSVQLGEFSGNVTPQASVKDQVFSQASTISTNPIVATAGTSDATPGELVVYAAGILYSSPATSTTSVAVNGFPGNDTVNDGTSTVNHYDFGWLVTESDSSPDTVSVTHTTTNMTSIAVSCISFKVVPTPGSTFSVSDPTATRPPGVH